MRKTLVICPKFHPTQDGLAGHTLNLCHELVKGSIETTLLTSKNKNYKSIKGIEVLPIVQSWTFIHLIKLILEIRNANYDSIIVQYVPSLYNKRGGINFSILPFFISLKVFTRSKIIFFFHELYFPFSFSLKPLVLHISHKFMLFFSLLSAHKALFSTQRFKKEASYFTLKRAKLIHCPIGASLFVQEDDFTELEKETPLTLTLLGSPHPSKRFDLLFSALDDIVSTKEFVLNIIGPKKERIKEIPSFSSRLEKRTNFTPKASDQMTYEILKNSDYSLGYFVDGMTTRRSSLISSLYAGTPILTTRTHHTENSLIDVPEITLLSTDEKLFRHQLFSFITNEAQKKTKVDHINTIKFYDNLFSWKNTIKLIKAP